MLIDELLAKWLEPCQTILDAIDPDKPETTREEFAEVRRHWRELGDPRTIFGILASAADSSRVRRNLEDELRVLETRLKNSEEARERLEDVRDGNVWYWQGAENHLESLSLDVVIKPSELLELLRKS